MTTALLSPASALIAHIESLVSDRRILVVGNAEHSIAEHLLDRGARLVQFLDPDARRVAHAAAHNGERRVTYAQLTDSSLRDGSFELAIIEDAGIADNLDKLVSGLQRSMNSRGLAVICTTNSDSSTGLLGANTGTVDYDQLAETTEDLFESVIMLGQSPFLGYSVVQFDLDHPPEPALDNAYLNEEGEQPDFYVALCGSEEAMAEVQLEDMSIVQLPAARFVENSEQIHQEKERRAARKVESLEGELKAEKAKGSDKDIERLTLELEQRDTWIKKLESRAEASDARADDAENELEELEKELESTHKALLRAHKDAESRASDKNAEKESANLKKDIKKLKADLEKAQDRADEAKHQSAGRQALEEEVDELHEENEKLIKALKDKTHSEQKLEKRLAAAEKELDELHEQLDTSEANDKLATELKNKSHANDKLKKRLKDAEKEIDELHEQLDETEDLLLAEKKKKKKPSEAAPSREAERDLLSLEDQLKKRGQKVSDLERQLKKLETFAKTLTAELAARGSSEGGVDQSQVDALAKALAEREADLVAAQWTIGQLKQSSLKD